MTQLHGERIAGERLQQPRDVVHGLLRALKAGRELDQQRPELAGGGERIDAALERIDVGLRDRPWIDGHVRVRELLIQLHREFEVRPASA